MKNNFTNSEEEISYVSKNSNSFIVQRPAHCGERHASYKVASEQQNGMKTLLRQQLRERVDLTTDYTEWKSLWSEKRTTVHGFNATYFRSNGRSVTLEHEHPTTIK